MLNARDTYRGWREHTWDGYPQNLQESAVLADRNTNCGL